MIYRRNLENDYREPLPYIISEVKDYVDIINMLRKREKITVEGIGHIIGVQKSTASKILRGQVSISTEKLIKILRYFGYELLICEKEIHEDYIPTIEEHHLNQEVWALAEEIRERFTGEDEEEGENN